MRKNFLTFLMLIVGISIFAGTALAQKDAEVTLDGPALLEKDALHNLDVARQAFGPGKKAYKQVIGRFEETFAVYPDFSKMDEFLYLAGMSSYYLSENKGKQKVDLKSERDKEKYSPEKLRTDAVAYFKLMLEKNPASPHKDEAESILKKLDPSDK